MHRLPLFRTILIGLLLAFWFPVLVSGQQSPVFYPDVFAITSQKCAPCHHKEGFAPFPLVNYQDVQERGNFVKMVTQMRYMPPWPADPEIRHFGNEIRLTDEEVQLIGDWVDGGMQKGKRAASGQHSYRARGPKTAPDTVLRPVDQIVVPGDGKDHFVYFLLPGSLETNLNVREIQFLPGNKRVVHHIELLLAAPGTFEGVEGRQLDESDYYGADFRATFGNHFEYLAGWLPGNEGEQYPEGAGFVLPAGARLILMVHYAPSPVEEVDLTQVGLYLSSAPPQFPVASIDLHGEGDLVDGPLFFPADSVVTFHAEKTVDKDFYAFAVFPHAHHLCTSLNAYAVTPALDTLPLLGIPKWDFDWQFTYYFPAYLFLPEGTEVYFSATYDNSAANPENPYSPPQDIFSSFKSNDEMMEFFIWGIESDTAQIAPLKFRWQHP